MRGIARYFGHREPFFDDLLHGFMIGSKLGDGSFIQRTKNHNVYVVFKHSVIQYEYLCWKHAFLKARGVLKDNDVKKRDFRGTKKDSWNDQFLFSTASFEEFKIYNEMSISDLLRDMSELSFAIWLLDDGCVDRRSIKISCDRFTNEEREVASACILNKFGIINRASHLKKAGHIYIGTKEFENVKELISAALPDTLDVVRKKFSIQKDILKLQVKYHSKDYIPLSFVEGKSDWIDLRAAETVKFERGDYKLISLGVSIKMPEGYECWLVPRSSTFKNYGILQANSLGVIDSSFCGDGDIWRFPAYATRKTTVNEGERIAQFRIIENMPRLEIEEVDQLGFKDRGGFGSTGSK